MTCFFAHFRPFLRLAFRCASVALVGCLFLSGTAEAAVVQPGDDREVFESIRQADLKIATIGWRLASANAALCDRQEPGTGMQLHALDQYNGKAREAVRAYFKFATPIAIEGIAPGSPAEAAGLKADDALVRVGTVMIANLTGKADSTDRLVAAQLAIAALPLGAPIEIEALRDGKPVRVTILPVPVCKSRFEIVASRQWRSWADGTTVQVSLRFVEEFSEDQLAAVVAHELSHNVLHHAARLDARGLDFGLLSGFGGNVKYFRQTEVQADLLSVYLLTNAGYAPRASIAFWQKFGPKSGGIFAVRSHPAWRDRIATLEAEIANIEADPARPIAPAWLQTRDQPLDGNWQAILKRHH